MAGNRQSGRLPTHPGEKLFHGRRLLDIHEVGECFGVSASTVRRWRAKVCTISAVTKLLLVLSVASADVGSCSSRGFCGANYLDPNGTVRRHFGS
jgi:hypothetical protein